MALFTPEELEEMRLADEEIEADFVQTQEEIVESRRRDRAAKLDRLDNKGRRCAAQRAAWYQANKEKWNAYQRAYSKRRKEKATPGVAVRKAAVEKHPSPF